MHNAVLLVWGSLRLTPISRKYIEVFKHMPIPEAQPYHPLFTDCMCTSILFLYLLFSVLIQLIMPIAWQMCKYSSILFSAYQLNLSKHLQQYLDFVGRKFVSGQQSMKIGTP